MARKEREFNFAECMLKLKRAGIAGSPAPIRAVSLDQSLEPLTVRIQRILGIIEKHKSSANSMIYFVMYDIESNKVRRLVAKYLLRQGFHRIQKSIFLAETERRIFDQVRKDLKAVQECYENDDSIILVPVSTEQLSAMKVLGQNIDLDLILKTRNTMFF